MSAAADMLDDKASKGETVTEEERLGDTFHGRAHHTAPHKWAAVTWRQATAAATTDTVYLGDKAKGKQHYRQFNAGWVPDVIRLTGDGGKPELLEIKNYSPIVRRNASSDGPTEHMGHEYAFGNTEEALKLRVLGTRQRGLPAAGRFNHKTGAGYVKAKLGDYADAILNRKANVKLLCHEIFGGMSSYAARHLRRLARDAARGGADATDYTLSAMASSFVPFYAQRISSNIVMHSARNALEHVKRLRRDPLRAIPRELAWPRGRERPPSTRRALAALRGLRS